MFSKARPGFYIVPLWFYLSGTMWNTVVRKCHHVVSRLKVQPLRTCVGEEVVFRSKVLEGLARFLAALVVFELPPGLHEMVLEDSRGAPGFPGLLRLLLGKDSLKLFENELHYLALENHVDSHVS